MSSILDVVLQEREEISNEKDSLKSKLGIALNENKILKSKNDCDDVLKKNDVLSSKLFFILKENDSLKNKIISISKELDLISNENKSLKNDLSSHVCHASIASSSSLPIACSTLSSSIKNDICILKKSVDYLGSTLSQCALNHTRLEPWFERNKFHLCMHTLHGIHMLLTVTTITFCYDRIHDENLATKFVWVRKGAN